MAPLGLATLRLSVRANSIRRCESPVATPRPKHRCSCSCLDWCRSSSTSRPPTSSWSISSSSTTRAAAATPTAREACELGEPELLELALGWQIRPLRVSRAV